MDQEASHLHFFGNLGLERMSPSDQAQLGLSMKEGLVVMSDSISGGSSSIDDDDDDSMNSIGSTSSSDLVEDASSSSPTKKGPLYELSELMAQLPIKRGLSKYYQGKSQSYTSLASVQSLEDLAKKGSFRNRLKMKSCKSCPAGLEGRRRCFSPKATISKRASRGSFSNLGRR